MSVRSNRREVEALLAREVNRRLDAVGIAVVNEVQRLTPVDTGRLRSSMVHEVDARNGRVIVGTHVEYAAAVELGGVHTRPQPYLVPGLEAARGNIRRILGETIR